jgi:hypothetical protein
VSFGKQPKRYLTFPRKSGHEAKPNKSCIIPLSEGKP